MVWLVVGFDGLVGCGFWWSCWLWVLMVLLVVGFDGLVGCGFDGLVMGISPMSSDLNPNNVLVYEIEYEALNVKVSDFGLSRELERNTSVTGM